MLTSAQRKEIITKLRAIENLMLSFFFRNNFNAKPANDRFK
jgi:hypothetical protein